MKIEGVIFFAISFFFSLSLQAQNSIKGVVVDTTLNSNLFDATVSVLHSQDSILEKFTYTDNNGFFTITGLPIGKYILLVTKKEYASYVEPFNIDDPNSLHDFKSILLQKKAKLLEEVIINGIATAITFKGDTAEYNAGSFVIQPNDKVEDLLKRLPGIQVDKDGRITAQGQTVNKVLVDGEEFFSDDPTLVTRNIRADMVSSVQLYDKKSDQATFTGIDDGEKTKTINIKLKEDKKRGLFGKIDLGGGTHEYYQAQALLNRFKNDEKFSIYGTYANNGKVGLGFLDNNKLGSGNLEIPDDGIVPLPTNGDLDASTGMYDGRGNPLAKSAGAHYDNKWNDRKHSVNTNYKVGSLEVDGLNTTQVQQSFPTTLLNTINSQQFRKKTFRQKADITFQFTIDTSSNIKIYFDATTKNIRNNLDYSTVNTDGNNLLLNDELRSNNIDGRQDIFNTNIFYTKKFLKPRRTISLNFVMSHNNSNSDEFLNSTVNLYDESGNIFDKQVTNQKKNTDIDNRVLSSNIAYTEPLSKNLSLLLNYAFGINNNDSRRESFNPSSSGQYDILDPRFSNHYKFNQLLNQVGTFINYNGNKTILNFGTKLSNVNFNQNDLYSNQTTKRTFINWAPHANYRYSFSRSKSLSIEYSGANIQPTVDQIQPITINNSPLVLIVGNPLLKPYFTNNVNATFRGSKAQSGEYFYISPSYSIISNPIINDIQTDGTGKTLLSYKNFSEKQAYNYSLFINYGRPIKAIGLSAAVTLSTTGNIYYSYTNGILNSTEDRFYSAALNLSRSKREKYSINANFSPNYTFSNFSLTSQSNNNAAGFTTRGSGRLFLPGNMEISADIDHFYKARTQELPEQNVVILNAAISKTFLKNNNLRLSISGNDLLNQNSNINRFVAGNAITQSTYSAIRRYIMLSVTWDFTKFGTIATNE